MNFTNYKYKLSYIHCNESDMTSLFQKRKLNPFSFLNLGKELSRFLRSNSKSKFLSYDVSNFIHQRCLAIYQKRNFTILLYNIGILFEPFLEIKPEQLLIELSSRFPIVFVWNGMIPSQCLFFWNSNEPLPAFDFSSITIHKQELL